MAHRSWRNDGSEPFVPWPALRWHVVWGCLLLCVLVEAACAGGSGGGIESGGRSHVAPPAAGQPAGAAPALPSPGSLLPLLAHADGTKPRNAAYVEMDLMHVGADFGLSLPRSKAAPDGMAVTLTPTGLGTGGLGGLAYCTYQFTVSGYDRNSEVRLQWAIPPPDFGNCFVGLANWDAGRWDWYPCPVSNKVETGAMSQYFNFADDLLLVVALAGTDAASLGMVRLGGPPPVADLYASPSTGAVPISVHLDASGSTTTEGTITKYEWDFNGDGVYDQDTGTTATVDHLFNSGGDIDLTVRVTNSFGASSKATQTISLTGPWAHTLGKSMGEDLESTTWDFSENIYATGYVHDPRPTGDVDLLLLTKWSPTGKVLWARTWDSGFKGAIGHDVQLDGDGNIIVAGEMVLDGGEYRAFLQKWTPDGGLTWSYQYYDPLSFHAGFVTLAVDGTDLYVAGFGPFYMGASQPLAMKLDTGGAPQWQYVYQTSASDWSVDSALRWTILTGTNAFFVLARHFSTKGGPVLLHFDLDGNLVAAVEYSDLTNPYNPTGLIVSQSSLDYTTEINVCGELTTGSGKGVFLTSCDGDYNVLHQSSWHGSADASVGKIMYGASSDVYISGKMPGLDAGSVYGMLWRFSTADGSLLSSEYWGDGTQKSSFYNLGWYQSGMLLMGIADDASASWGTLSGSTGAPTGTWSAYAGSVVTTNLYVDSDAGTVADYTGYTEDTGGGGADALLMWRAMS